MRFNGSISQNKWAADILANAELTAEQIDNLLCYAGPTMHGQGIMDVTIIIENRHNLAAYADSLGKFYKLSGEERHNVAKNAAAMVRQLTS